MVEVAGHVGGGNRVRGEGAGEQEEGLCEVHDDEGTKEGEGATGSASRDEEEREWEGYKEG